MNIEARISRLERRVEMIDDALGAKSLLMYAIFKNANPTRVIERLERSERMFPDYPDV